MSQVCNIELAGGAVMTDDNKEVYCSSDYDQYDILIFLIMSWQYLIDYLLRNASNVRSQLFQSMVVIQRQDWEPSIRTIILSVSNVRWNISVKDLITYHILAYYFRNVNWFLKMGAILQTTSHSVLIAMKTMYLHFNLNFQNYWIH